MKENTAMQELKEKLQAVVDSLGGAVHGTDQYGYRAAMENVIKDIDAQMLEVERGQIKDAYNEGYRDGEKDSATNNKFGDDVADFEDAEKYFTQTFNKPQTP